MVGRGSEVVEEVAVELGQVDGAGVELGSDAGETRRVNQTRGGHHCRGQSNHRDHNLHLCGLYIW